MSSRQRFVIAGMGSIGRRHARNLRELRPDASIIALRRAVGDPSETLDCDEVLCSVNAALARQPTAAVIAGPATTHVGLALRFLHAGVPVLVEKPLSHSLGGARELRDAAAAAGTTAMLAYNLRFDPAVIKLRELVMAGAAGKVLLARAYVGQFLPGWRPGTDYRTTVSARSATGGGALLELSHEIDLACWLFGRPRSVSCRGGRYSRLELDVEDVAELVLEYDGTPRLVTIGLNFLDRTASRTLSIIGEDATISWNGIARSVVFGCDGEKHAVHDFAANDRNDSYLAEVAQFLRCVELGDAPAITLDAGVDVLSVVEAARQSLRSGCRVDTRALD